LGYLDVAKFLNCVRSSTMKKLGYITTRRMNMSLPRDVECFRQLAVQVERYGVSILMPPEPQSFEDIVFFIEIVYDLFWDCQRFGVEPYLQKIISRDELYITTLTSHLHLCIEEASCSTRHILMAKYIALHLNSKSVISVRNCEFLKEVVSLVRSNRQHVVLFALNVLQVLLSVREKVLKKVLKIVRSVELGVGLAISNLLRQYASNGLRKMEICECKTSFTSEKDCAAHCMQGVYEIILMLHELCGTAIFPKCFGEDLARVVRTREFVTPFMGRELDKVYNRGFNLVHMARTLQTMRNYYDNLKLRCCDNDNCVKIETIDQHFKFCARCKVPRYCSSTCQKMHWVNEHKLHCFSILEI